jgi:peptide/nickel transport system substrate-binding protein
MIPRLYDSLMGFHAGLVPLLAKAAPTISSDQRTYTFQLRQDAKWSDGKPVTAADVVYTYKLLYHPDYKDVKSQYRGQSEAAIESVDAQDQYTVVMRTKRIYAPFQVVHAVRPILPLHVFGALSVQDFNNYDWARKDLITSGAFKFGEYVKGSHFTVVHNDGYYMGRPKLDSYTLKVITDATATLNQLKTAEVDCSRVFTINAIPDLQKASSLTVWDASFNGLINLVFQLDPNKRAGKFLSDKRVRQALSFAIDRQGIADAVYFKIGASAADSYLTSLSWAYKANTAAFKFDKAKAEQLLDDAGWKRGASGVRQRDGVPMKLELLASTGVAEGPASAEIIQKNWKDVGLDVSVRPTEFAQIVTQLTTTRDFDVAQWFPATGDPDPDGDRGLSALYHSRAIANGGLNGGGFKNDRLDTLLDDALATTDQEKRKVLYAEAQDILADEQPAPPFAAFKVFFVFNKRVRGYSTQELAARAIRGSKVFFKDVWVSDGK